MENRRQTPIMGWASWNCFRTHISEKKLKKQMDALVSTGLAACGYTYCNMDDGFFGGRTAAGQLRFHRWRFPNGIRPIVDYAHAKGLKAGVYADGGDQTCGFYYDHEGRNGSHVGLYGHEEQDLRLYLEEYGFDFIKVDWCGGLRLGLDEQEQYTKIGNIIDAIRRETGRTIVYNICRWQFPGAWAVQVADSWRTGADIAPRFDSVVHQLDVAKPLRRFCGPGHVNDLDMMQLGNGLAPEEEKTHFAMWCMMSTPLIIGCDLTAIRPETLALLKNTELIALDQDPACLQAYVVKELRAPDGALLGEIWLKDLGQADSPTKAVAFLNRSGQPLDFCATLAQLGLGGAVKCARELCEHRDIEAGAELSACVPPHGVAVYRLECEQALPVCDVNAQLEPPALAPVERIGPEQAKELLAQGAYLVDVREKGEYLLGHLPGAVNIPYTEIHATAGASLSDKERAVILYCRTGKRSAQAKTSLECLGYRRVYSYVPENI